MIVFDLTLATRRRQLTGIERYGINLFRAMRELDFETIAFAADASLIPGDGVTEVGGSLTGWLQLPRLVSSLGKPATVVCPSYPASPLFRFTRQHLVRIIHDDFPWTRGETMSRGGRLLFKHIETGMLPRYDVVAAPTKIFADALTARFNRPVLHCGNAAGLDLDAVAPRELAGISRPFVLLVGTVEPRKNYDALIDFLEFSVGTAPTFVVAGRAGRGDVVSRLERASRRHDKLVWLRDTDDAQLAWLYENCAAFLSLSQAEGFNMPLVEAGMAGCPIVCSDLPVHRSVAAPGALFVNAGAPPEVVAAALAEASARPHRDPGDYRRRFGWADVARSVAALAAA